MGKVWRWRRARHPPCMMVTEARRGYKSSITPIAHSSPSPWRSFFKTPWAVESQNRRYERLHAGKDINVVSERGDSLRLRSGHASAAIAPYRMTQLRYLRNRRVDGGVIAIDDAAPTARAQRSCHPSPPLADHRPERRRRCRAVASRSGPDQWCHTPDCGSHVPNPESR